MEKEEERDEALICVSSNIPDTDTSKQVGEANTLPKK